MPMTIFEQVRKKKNIKTKQEFLERLKMPRSSYNYLTFEANDMLVSTMLQLFDLSKHDYTPAQFIAMLKEDLCNQQ